MSTRAQRRERAQARRTADPVADRAAAAAAIYAEYSTAAVAAFEKLQAAQGAAWEEWGREHAAAWETRCRKLGELQGREITTPDPVVAAGELEDQAASVAVDLASAKLRGHQAAAAELAAELGIKEPEEDR